MLYPMFLLSFTCSVLLLFYAVLEGTVYSVIMGSLFLSFSVMIAFGIIEEIVEEMIEKHLTKKRN